METPLDKVPPLREVSGAPFGAGSVLAGGAGGVAVIGIAGSTFRLLENICIGLGFLSNDHGTVIHKGQPFPSFPSEKLEPARPRADCKTLLRVAGRPHR